MRAKESGAVLLICLILLVPLLMLSLSAAETALLGERMAAGAVDRNRAFQSAEAALEAAESWLADLASFPQASSEVGGQVWAEGVLNSPSAGALWWSDSDRDMAWWRSNAVPVTTVPDLAEPAHYIIEQYRFVRDGESIELGTGQQRSLVAYHRITALGVGRRNSTRVLLQTTYVRAFDE